jgi:CheY-like chemotaxis protein
MQPSLIVLDVMLSRKANASLLRRLKTTPETAEIPVVMVSLLEPPPEQQSAKDAAAYLTRPISQVTLLETLKRVLSDSAE